MKRILTTLLALNLILSCFPLSAFAAPSERNAQPESSSVAASPSSTPLDEASLATMEPVSQTTGKETPFASDSKGHWAEQVLHKAEQDGYLHGYPDGTLRPDAPILGSEITTILSRLLNIEICPAPQEPLSRAKAFVLLDEVLLLSAGEKATSLSSFGDSKLLNAEARGAFGALLHLGAVKGYSDATLRPDNTLTRAEFMSILYALPPQNKAAKDINLTETVNGRLSYPAPLESLTLADGVKVDTLVLGPDAGFTLRLGKDSSIGHLVLTGNGRSLTIPEGVQRVTVLRATNNSLTIDTKLDELTLLDGNNHISGKGSLKTLNNYLSSNQISVPAEQSNLGGLSSFQGLTLNLSAPPRLPAGDLLRITATIPPTTETLDCVAVWKVGGAIVKQDNATISPDGTTLEYLASFPYTQNMNTDFRIQLQVMLTTRDGEEKAISAEAQTTLENYPASHYDQYSPEKVLSRVTTGYQGDYTLAWAQANDYDAKTKGIWINAKGYSSKTKYLVWINTTYQRVNIFEGSQGNWNLIKSCIVGTGRNGHDTPVGVYTVGTRTKSGWTTDEYNVRPVVRFKMGSGLAFHSRKYDPKHTKMINASIGFPVSLGCIRMYDEDIWWIYDNIPEGTTVVVY